MAGTLATSNRRASTMHIYLYAERKYIDHLVHIYKYLLIWIRAAHPHPKYEFYFGKTVSE